MEAETVAQYKEKMAQAHAVIAHIMEKANLSGTEAQRALAYFGGNSFDADFLPWPRHPDEGLRPEELNAANDD